MSFNPQSPHKPLSYSFSRSPAKDLARINALMRVEVEKKSATRKRLLADEEEAENSSPAVVEASTTTAAAAAADGQTQMILVQEGDAPAVKMQIVQAAPREAGAVNTKLELVLGERTEASGNGQ